MDADECPKVLLEVDRGFYPVDIALRQVGVTSDEDVERLVVMGCQAFRRGDSPAGAGTTREFVTAARHAHTRVGFHHHPQQLEATLSGDFPRDGIAPKAIELKTHDDAVVNPPRVTGAAVLTDIPVHMKPAQRADGQILIDSCLVHAQRGPILLDFS